MSEAAFQEQAEAECDRLGLLWHHCADPRRCRGPRGFPDLVAVGPRGILLAELKGPYGETSAGQDRWHWAARQAGSHVPVVWPSDRAALWERLAQIS